MPLFRQLFLLSCFLFGGVITALGQPFFEDANAFFERFVVSPNVDYARLKKDPKTLQELIEQVRTFDLEQQPDQVQKAFWINAYNLLVIESVLKRYPVRSPKDIPGFFDKKLVEVAGKKMTLNELEKTYLLEAYQDPRIHFVLVCAARGCPPLIEGAYHPDRLEDQLVRATKQAINDPGFIQVRAAEVRISPIFRWYLSDFGSIRDFINQYLTNPIDQKIPIRYYPYDWALNDLVEGKNFQLPFQASDLLQRGEAEIKIFNSVYTQRNLDGFSTANSRSTYFSSFGQFLFGFKPKWNIGFDLVYKSNVINDFAQRSPFEALRFETYTDYPTFLCGPEYNINSHHTNCFSPIDPPIDTLRHADGTVLQRTARIGLSHFGPKFKIIPFKRWQKLSWQQTFYIPIQRSVDGSWVSFSQFFYDQPIGSRFQLFSEVSMWTTVAPNFRVFPAVKVFYSYFPNRRWTLYAMTSIPIEYGAGTKFQLTPKWEIELLYTHYAPITFLLGDARPSTFNLGFRYRG